METKDKVLQIILFELLFSNTQNRKHAEGITAVELSKKYNIKIEHIKKKLKILQEKGLVRSTGASPKFWIFDEYKFQRLDDEDPIQHLLCYTDEIDFDAYFKYS